jgi:hypothetical protein
MYGISGKSYGIHVLFAVFQQVKQVVYVFLYQWFNSFV